MLISYFYMHVVSFFLAFYTYFLIFYFCLTLPFPFCISMRRWRFLYFIFFILLIIYLMINYLFDSSFFYSLISIFLMYSVALTVPFLSKSPMSIRIVSHFTKHSKKYKAFCSLVCIPVLAYYLLANRLLNIGWNILFEFGPFMFIVFVYVVAFCAIVVILYRSELFSFFSLRKDKLISFFRGTITSDGKLNIQKTVLFFSGVSLMLRGIYLFSKLESKDITKDKLPVYKSFFEEEYLTDYRTLEIFISLINLFILYVFVSIRKYP